jgi:hypothetical protein
MLKLNIFKTAGNYKAMSGKKDVTEIIDCYVKKATIQKKMIGLVQQKVGQTGTNPG